MLDLETGKIKDFVKFDIGNLVSAIILRFGVPSSLVLPPAQLRFQMCTAAVSSGCTQVSVVSSCEINVVG